MCFIGGRVITLPEVFMMMPFLLLFLCHTVASKDSQTNKRKNDSRRNGYNKNMNNEARVLVHEKLHFKYWLSHSHDIY